MLLLRDASIETWIWRRDRTVGDDDDDSDDDDDDPVNHHTTRSTM